MKYSEPRLANLLNSWGVRLAKLCSAVTLILGALWVSPLYAEIGSCSASSFQASGGWDIKQPATFGNGTVLASITMKLPITLTNIRGGGNSTTGADSVYSWGIQTNAGGSYPNYDTSTNSVPLSTTSGIGGRMTITSLTSNILTRVISYTPVILAPNTLDVAYAYLPTSNNFIRYNGSVTYYAQYELVIVDAAKYAANDTTTTLLSQYMAAQRGPQLLVGMYVYPDSTGTQSTINCFRGSNYALNLPQLQSALPKDLPTCKFSAGELNQTVKLNSATQSQIASQGSTRSAGTVGEMAFSITASACGKGAVYSTYFTDALHTGSQQNYLQPSADNKVGVRLYHSNETAPITFGPTPTGSTLPSQAPIQYGNSSAAAGASYTMPFTAQYVRMPGVDTAPAGAVTAMATVTIVYP